jgi:PAS domain S-box-containing protein
MAAASLKILIVEDNPADFVLVKACLKNISSPSPLIHNAKNLHEARAAVQLEVFDIILLDLTLPDSFGLETFHSLSVLVPSSAIIVLTGLADEKIALESLKLGAQDYLVKGEYNEALLGRSIRYAIERKYNNDLLKTSEENYKILFEGNPIPMWAYDANSLQILMVNYAAIKHYGFSKAEFLNMTIRDIRPPGDVELLENRVADVKTFGVPISHAGFWRHRKKDNSVIDVEIVSHSIHLNNVSARLVVAYDVTERRNTESHLRLLESVVVHTNDAVLVTEALPTGAAGLKIVYVNKAFSEMTGYSANEVLGKTPRLLQGAKTEQKHLDIVRHALATWQRAEIELINYRKDNSEYWVNFSIVPVADEKGIYTHWISIQRDVTENRQSQETIRKKLEDQVEERTRELHEALSKEKELVELKNRFVAIASHEFRTPLSTINFATNFLQQHFSKLDPAEINNKLQRIEKQVMHMTALLEDVITVGRSEMNKIPVVTSGIELQSFVTKIVEEVRHTTKNSHQIHITYRGLSGDVETDEKLLRNIFINLLTNAIKFSPNKKDISLVIDETSNHILAEVHDEGIGICDADKEKLFDPFHRGSNTNAIPGTGLGLSIVKKAVELLDGTIEVDSKVNFGTTFKISIPVNR